MELILLIIVAVTTIGFSMIIGLIIGYRDGVRDTEKRFEDKWK